MKEAHLQYIKLRNVMILGPSEIPQIMKSSDFKIHRKLKENLQISGQFQNSGTNYQPQICRVLRFLGQRLQGLTVPQFSN